MPQVEILKQNHHRRNVAIVGGAAALVVILVAVVVFAIWRSMPSAQDVVRQADALNAQGKYKDAYDKLQTAYGSAFISKSDKTLLLSRLAATKYDMADYAAALNYYQQLDKLQPHNAGTLVTIGDLAVQMGDKATAMSAYNEAIPLMQSGPQGPTTAANIDDLKRQVAELQK